MKRLALPAWLAFLAATIVFLDWLREGPLALSSPREWLTGSDPVALTLALVCTAAYVVACYLLGCAALSALAALTKSKSLARAVSFVSLPSVRRVNRRIIELSLIGALAVPGVASAASFDQAIVEVPVLRHQTAATTSTTVPNPPPQTTVPAEPRVIEQERWTISAGENLWLVAETVTTERLGRAPTEAELASYWQRLVETNRELLPDTGNPDLVFPGQKLSLPR